MIVTTMGELENEEENGRDDRMSLGTTAPAKVDTAPRVRLFSPGTVFSLSVPTRAFTEHAPATICRGTFALSPGR